MAPQTIRLDIQSDVNRLVKQMKADVKAVNPALNAAINQVAVTIRKVGIKQLSQETGLKQNKLRKSITLTKSNFSTLSARIEARGKPFNLASFSARVKKAKGKSTGVTARPWNRKRFFPKTFFLNVPGKPVFKRTGKGRRAIKPVYGPGIARESLRRHIIDLYNKTGLRRFNEVFPRQLKFRMSKRTR